MGSSRNQRHNRIIVDSIHGDIHLKGREPEIVDTPSFQRLRYLKQLAMAHITYPGATHTRFSHSLGTLAIMARILEVPEVKDCLPEEEDQENLRMAALLHDVGHYPYSHLMELIDRVRLTEEQIGTTAESDKTVEFVGTPYPSHTKVGEHIVTNQDDLIKAIGSEERAQKVADLFTRSEPADPQFSKLITSSLDMDRLDYLPRDSHATGVPYGRVDINYLLNNLQISPGGLLGISIKALPAAEHFLLARFFMHRTVYFHKTTYGMEEACRQLLRRIRDKKIRKEGNHEKYHIPVDEKGVLHLAGSEEVVGFTDAYVDRLIQEATKDDDDKVIQTLARAIQSRKPPKLLNGVEILAHKEPHRGTVFRHNCIDHLRDLSEEFKIPLGQFLLCETKPLRFEERGPLLTAQEARKLPSEEKDELIKVFNGSGEEPVSIVDVGDKSLIPLCANHFFQAFRLYVVYEANDKERVVNDLKERVKDWDKPPTVR